MADYKKYDAAPPGTPVANFVHLHVHSDYSLLDSCATVDKLVEKAKSLNMPALALTDHGNLFGALYFEHLCHENGINPIVGEEFYVAYGSHYEKNDVPFSKNFDTEDSAGKTRHAHYFHLILLCENQKGYENISLLSSRAFCDENAIYYGKPRIDFELLKEYHEGLICCSACIQGEIPQYLLNGKDEEAYRIAKEYKELFGPDHYYIELQDHGIPEQKIVAEKLIKLAKDLDIPLIVTNDVHYIEREDAVAQDALRCIGFKNKLHEPHSKMGGDRDLDNWYFKTEQEMRQLFPQVPEAYDNTVKIANMCNLHIKQYSTRELKDCLPRFELPQNFQTHGDDYQANQNDYVRYLVEEGLKNRYKEITPEIRKRADYEMETIFSMGFSGYFLIVWEFINWAKSTYDNVNKKPKPYIPIGPGRGSGAGSLVAYAMSITDIDPFRFDLFFERFLNPERISMPDFDIDMDFDYRQDIIQHTRDLYGDECVGHIVTFGTLKPKNCIADVGRILDIPLSEVTNLKKCLSDNPKFRLKDAFSPPNEKFPDGGGLIPYKDDPRYQELFELAFKLEGCKRNTGLHASGMVIGLTQLPHWAPVFKDHKTGEVGVQYTMDIIEPCGLVKFDYLGLKTLSLIRYAEEIINRHKKNPDDPDFITDKISESDKKTFDLFKRGDSVAVFQFESPGMQKILKQFQPEKLEDLVALNALYRPGPMDCIPQYIEGKWKPETIRYPDPSLEETLKETYGVMVYQEQIMKVAQIIAGFSLGGADMLRRAMGKKKPEVLLSKKKDFVDGALKIGHTQKHAEDIFEIMVPFAGYGFNKSHAAAYSVLAYRTGYLKAHYPAEFMAANLTNERNTADTLPEYLNECKNMGIPILPPNVNISDKFFDAVDGKIVYGLAGIKGLGEGAAESIINERKKNGPYTSFVDFVERLHGSGINKKVLEVLIKTGGFDEIENNRNRLIVNMDRVVVYVAKKMEEKALGQTSLFGDDDFKEYDSFKYEEVEDWTKLERLGIEKEFTGFYLSGHPLDEYKKILTECVNMNSSRLNQAVKNYEYIIAGMIKEIHSFPTKKGETMANVILTDYDGDIKLTFFPKVWALLSSEIQVEKILSFKGKVDISEQYGASFQVSEMLDINNLKKRSIKSVHLKLFENAISRSKIEELRDLLVAHNGNCSVYLHVDSDNKNYVIQASSSLLVSSDEEFLQELKKQPILEKVWKD
ncbi:MAG: DNA polymerase III subunit alpha [Treponemataceae bacterium]